MKWFEDLEKALRLYEELKEAQGEEKESKISLLMELESIQEESDGRV